MTSHVHDLMKQRGFYQTLSILAGYEEGTVRRAIFFQKLQDTLGYYNMYHRVKTRMLKYDLIQLQLDETGEFIIHLTEKGKRIAKIIQDIDIILSTPNTHSDIH